MLIMIFNKFKISFVFKIILLYISLFELSSCVFANNKDIEKIEALVHNCLNENNLNSCNNSLFSLEELQVQAVKNKMYSCQTRILGLEADLIMQTHGLIRTVPALKRLDEVKSSC